MAARLGQRSVPGTQIANARRATGLLQHRAVQHEELGTRRIPHQAKRVTAPGASARCAQRRRGSQCREDHRDPRASHGPARLVRYRGDRLPSAGGRPEQMSVRAPASWDLSLTRGVESTHCTYGKPHTHGSRDRSRGCGAGERWQREHRGRALRERRRVAGVLRTFLRPPRGACTVFRRRPSMAVVRPRDDGSCGAGRPRAASP